MFKWFLFGITHRQDVIDRKAATIIQKIARTYIVKQRIKSKHKAAYKIQGFIKMKWLSALFQDLRKNVLIIQVKFESLQQNIYI